MADLYADLPGAPPAGDPGHLPAGATPTGAVPDATPYAPKFVDPDSLSPAQKFALRQAINSGDRGAYEAALAQLNGEPTTPEPAPAAAEGELGEPLTASHEDDARLAAALEEHGSHPEALEALAPGIAAFERSLEGLDAGEREAALIAGDAEVLQRVYRGDEAALAQGLREIKEAAVKLGVDPAAIDETGILANPQLHLKVHLMARAILAGGKS